MEEYNGILFVNKTMLDAKANFEKDAQDLKNAGTALVTSLGTTLANFDGATKEAVMEKIGASGTASDKTLAFFVEQQVPQMLTNLATLLEANRSTLEQGDKMLADQISGNAK